MGHNVHYRQVFAVFLFFRWLFEGGYGLLNAASTAA